MTVNMLNRVTTQNGYFVRYTYISLLFYFGGFMDLAKLSEKTSDDLKKHRKFNAPVYFCSQQPLDVSKINSDVITPEKKSS